MTNILEADPGINQGQPFTLLEQKTVADNRGKRWDQERPAVDVMNRRHIASSQALNIAASDSGSASR
jgi:hypothetical protein